MRESQAFIAALTDVAPATRRAYARELDQYIAWLLAKDVTTPRQVTTTIVESYARQLRAPRVARVPRGARATTSRGYSSPSIARKLGVVRAWHRFLAREHDYHDPTVGVAMPTANPRVPRVLTVEQIQSLLDAPTRDEPLGQRDRAVLVLLYYSGLSAAEVCGLRREDWDARRGRLRNWRTAGEWPPEATEALGQFLADGRRRLLSPGVVRLRSSPLLPGRNGRPLTVAAVHRMVRLSAERRGLPRWVTPRTLRDARAVHLIDSGADLRRAGALLGHANLATTERRTRPQPQRLRAAYDKAHPRA